MSSPVLKVENVSKKFCKSMKNLMLYGSLDIMRDFAGIPSKTEQLRSAEFWAVKDVSFELRKGETLGLIGINGSGKSTLLKMINGIFFPDTGKITYSGKMSALIQVGVGFHPLLTGRENVYINGQIIGMSKKEIDERYDEIVEFSEIGDFIDSPVKHYSSGMLVRLGFSVAVHCNPDIMLIDEVLAVGDIAFRKKCAEKIEEIKSKTGVVLVSHNMNQVSRLCDKSILLSNGIVEMAGDTNDVVGHYYNTKIIIDKKNGSALRVKNSTGVIKDITVDMKNSKEEKCTKFHVADDIIIDINIYSNEKVEKPNIGVSIHLDNGQCIVGILNAHNEEDLIDYLKIGTNSFRIRFKKLPINPGNYEIIIRIKDQLGITTLLTVDKVLFSIISDNYLLKTNSLVNVDYEWINN